MRDKSRWQSNGREKCDAKSETVAMRYLVIYNQEAIYSLSDARNMRNEDCGSRAGNKTLEIYRWMIYSVLDRLDAATWKYLVELKYSYFVIGGIDCYQ